MSDYCELSEEQRKSLLQHEKKKAQDRARQKAYYDRNPRKVLDRQKNARQKAKDEVEEIRKMFAIHTIQDDNLDDIQEQNVVVEEPQVNISNNSNYTQDEIIALIKNDKNIKSKNTRSTYVSSIKRLFTMTGCTDMKKCLNSYKKMLNSIEKSDYSINSIKQTLQSLLFVADKYNILHNLFSKKKADDLKKFFKSAFEKFKDKSITQLEVAQKTIHYPSFNEYLDRVTNKYGEASKEYLISYLYSQFTVRDDFKNMKIIQKNSDDNKEDNFILINGNKMMFIINNFKTKNKYERLEFTITGKLKTLLLQWTKTKKIGYNDFLFGKSSLSPFVSKLNKSLGYDNLKGVNIYRHMRVSDLYKGKKDLTFEEREKLSNEMGHSLIVQSQYRRNLKVTDA